MNKRLLMSRITVFLLSLLMILTSCVTPPVTSTKEVKNTSISLSNQQSNDVVEKDVFFNGKKVGFFSIETTPPSFGVKDIGASCMGIERYTQTGNLDYTNCTLTVNFVENGQVLRTLVNPVDGVYTQRIGCSCGVHNASITNVGTGSCSLNSTLDKTITYSCPIDAKPTPAPVKTTCQKGSILICPAAMGSLANLLGGRPIRSFSTNSFDPNDENIEPENDTITTKIDELVSNTELISAYGNEILSLTARNSLQSNIDELTSKKNILEIRNSILKVNILTTLTSSKNAIRTEVNNLLGTTYSVDQPKPSTLDEYQQAFDSLEQTYNLYVNSDNTVDLTKASSVVADEQKLLIDLVNDYTSGSFSIQSFRIEGGSKNKAGSKLSKMSKKTKNNGKKAKTHINNSTSCPNGACGGDPYDNFAPRFKGNNNSKGPHGEIGYFQGHVVMDFDHTEPDPYLTFEFTPTLKNYKANNRVDLENYYDSNGFISSSAVSVSSSVDTGNNDDARLEGTPPNVANIKEFNKLRAQDRTASRIGAQQHLSVAIEERTDKSKPNSYSPYTATILKNVKEATGSNTVESITSDNPRENTWVASMGVKLKPVTQDISINIGTGDNVHKIKYHLERIPQVPNEKGVLNSAWIVTPKP